MADYDETDSTPCSPNEAAGHSPMSKIHFMSVPNTHLMSVPNNHPLSVPNNHISTDESDIEVDGCPITPPFQFITDETTHSPVTKKQCRKTDSFGVVASPEFNSGSLKSSLNGNHLNGNTRKESGMKSEHRVVYIKGSVESDAVELMEDVVEMMTEKKSNTSSRSKPNRHFHVMKRTVIELSERHEILFKGMMKKLEITRDNASIIFIKVVDEIFTDDMYNWGRIATVYAFAGWLARYCTQNDLKDCVEPITETAGQYVAKRLKSFITKSGGWEAFDEFFKEQDTPDKQIWRGLFYTIFGLGAVATVIAAR